MEDIKDGVVVEQKESLEVDTTIPEGAAKVEGITDEMIGTDPRVIAAINRGVATARKNLEEKLKSEYAEKNKQYEEIQKGEASKLITELEEKIANLNGKLDSFNGGVEPIIEKIKSGIHEDYLDLVDDMVVSDDPVATINRLMKLQAKSPKVAEPNVGTGGSTLNAKPRAASSDEVPSIEQWKKMSVADKNNLPLDIRTKVFNKYGFEALK